MSSLLKIKRQKNQQIKHLRLKIKQKNRHSRKYLKVIVVIAESKDTRESIAGRKNDKRMVTTAMAITRATTMEVEETKVKLNVMGAENWVITPTSVKTIRKPVMRFRACSLEVSNSTKNQKKQDLNGSLQAWQRPAWSTKLQIKKSWSVKLRLNGKVEE
jgi:seryl-tRNA synthetase